MPVSILPTWEIQTSNQSLPMREVIHLLRNIHESGKLTQAAIAAGISYRHAWNILDRWETGLGAPLVIKSKGQGSRLSAAGETLLWSHERLLARLGPQLESMASELAADLQQTLSHTRPVLRVFASHGYAVASLADNRTELDMNLQYCNSGDAIKALVRGDADLAGIHVPVEPRHARVFLNRYRKALGKKDYITCNFIIREQGLIFHPGLDNPPTRLRDLVASNYRFINREKLSGTRELLQLLMDDDGIDGSSIAGFPQEEYTHTAVAAYVASGMADVGFGVKAAAMKFDLGFLPLAHERYLWVCRKNYINEPKIRRFLDCINGVDFQEKIKRLPGYSKDTNEILQL